MIPGRMVLLITLLLMLTNIFTSVTSQSPTTKSLTSISTWILTCILFVYGALMEYGCILGLLTYILKYHYLKLLLFVGCICI